MTTKKPYLEIFQCSLIGSNVSITGVIAMLESRGTVDQSQPTRLSCSGMPGCGQVLGSDRCPHKSKWEGGN
jgi:hypothetical protein